MVFAYEDIIPPECYHEVHFIGINLNLCSLEEMGIFLKYLKELRGLCKISFK